MVTKIELKTKIHELVNQLNAARVCLDVLKARVRRLKNYNNNIKRAAGHTKNFDRKNRRRPDSRDELGCDMMCVTDGIYE